ncbi:MAG TPA: GMC oxidoreductase [Pyrinomonadaceae bacterium]|jgi:choline dehydrogenase-like flavoprotein
MTQKLQNEYDYVVGADSAGCVLARRLTEDPGARVLLVEAGDPDRRREIQIPAAFGKLFKTECDWNYETEPPSIEPRYLEDGADLRLLVEGVRLALGLAHTKALGDCRGAPVCAKLSTDEEIVAHVRATAETVYHPAGTCRMGNDVSAATDARLRVRGVEGLRVVDASVMPEIVGGNTNAAVIMLAEKAADDIRAGA